MINISEYITLSTNKRKTHINLNTDCIIRGGDSIQFRGLLAYYLDTTIPSGHKILCCHACNNQDCSNPLHLYWGTSGENRQDMLDFHGKKFNQKLSESLKGNKNPNFGCKPWKITGGHIQSWKLANIIYQENIGIDWKKYGFGASYLEKKYAIARGSAKTMVKMFREGWNPSLDSEWLNDFY